MTDTERAELKRLAEAAANEPGIIPGDAWSRFRGAANPTAVLDLLADVDAAAASEDSRTEETRRHAETKRLLEEALAENERIKAEVQRMKDDAQDAAWERDEAEDR